SGESCDPRREASGGPADVHRGRLDPAALWLPRVGGLMAGSARRLDWVLLAAVLALLTLSALLVWSATSHRIDLTGGDTTAYLRRQVTNIVIGVGLLCAAVRMDYRWLRVVAPLVYLL